MLSEDSILRGDISLPESTRECLTDATDALAGDGDMMFSLAEPDDAFESREEMVLREGTETGPGTGPGPGLLSGAVA
jgi:hypothetical protein